jgi:outer membrane protein assembly factor BamB
MNIVKRILVALLFLFCAVPKGRAQTLLWESVQDLNDVDLTRAMVLSKGSAVLIGNSASGSADVSDFVVESFRRVSGAVLWTAQTPEYPGYIAPLQIASARGRIFAAGYAAGATPGSTDIVVRTYDAVTGALLWGDVWDSGRDDMAQGIAANAKAVVVVGDGADVAGQSLQFIVRAYNPATGSVLWEDHVSRSGLDAEAWTVAMTQDRVVVAGGINGTPGDLLIRVYNVKSGALLWETTRPSTGVVAVKANADGVFLAGASSRQYYIGAYDIKNGTLLWEDQGGAASAQFLDLAVTGDQVVATGMQQSALILNAYDAATGARRWEALTSPPVGVNDRGVAVASNGRAVYVCGGSSNAQNFEDSEFLVQAYDAATGTLLWDDRSHGSSYSRAVDLALGKNRLFVAGYATSTTMDFVMRAYDIRGDAPSDPGAISD